MQKWMQQSFSAIRSVLPSTARTCWWMVRLTVGVSFLVFLLDYFRLLPYFSQWLQPVFSTLGLPGEAALAYVSGYFVNVYSAIAVGVTLDLGPRAMTILGVMVLCSHNMFVETAIQRKTGTPWVRTVVVRTLSGILLALALNQVLPPEDVVEMTGASAVFAAADGIAEAGVTFGEAFWAWAQTTLKLAAKMALLIFLLNILQKLLAEFGVTQALSRILAPFLRVFGLPARCSFLWIVANTLGLAYGGAAMLEEVERGDLSQEDIDLLNLHIGISHSNLEDLVLIASIGAIWWIVLLSRWILSLLLVWSYRAWLHLHSSHVSA
jgi:hypothetical protein